MIFPAQPGWRLVKWGLNYSKLTLWFHEFEVLAWRTTPKGLVPVGCNELACAGCSADQLHGNDYAVVSPNGHVICHGEYYTVDPDRTVRYIECPSVDEFKATMRHKFNDGRFYFDDKNSDHKYRVSLPGAKEYRAAVAEARRLTPHSSGDATGAQEAGQGRATAGATVPGSR